jgi:CubicO group peptidase (beta-lactamase class C family)
VETVIGDFDSSLTPLLDQMVKAIDVGELVRGVSIEIHLAGDVMASCAIGTDGLEQTLSPDSMFAVYCATKPIVALAIGALVAAGELSWEDRLADILDDVGSSDRVTVEQLLTHTAGLHRLRANRMLAKSPSDRRMEALAHASPADWVPSADLGYSNFLGWYWLLRVIEAVTEVSVVSYLRDAVVAPLGLTGSVYPGVSLEDVDEIIGRCAVNVDLTDKGPVPLLLERSPTFMCDPDVPAVGGYATVRGLCELYEQLSLILSGERDSAGRISKELLAEMLLPRVVNRYDRVMQRESSWGLGFMVDLESHFFGERVGPRAFGHSGNAGSSFAFCDPDHGLSMAVLYTARVDDNFAVEVRRRTFVERTYQALDLS